MNNKKNWFVRILVILLCCGIGVLIYFSFTKSTQKYVITSGIAVLVAILVVLVLAEIFDSFSVGNLISLNKKYNETKTDLENSKKENESLRNQLNAQFNFLASQKNVNYNILGHGFEKILGVEKAQEETIKEEKEQEKQRNFQDYVKQRQRIKNFENYACGQIINEYKITDSKIYREVQFKEPMLWSDPIMDKNMIIDAYFTSNDCEYFVEFKNTTSLYGFYIYQIYYILSKIHFYQSATKKKAKLLLVFPKYTGDSEKNKTFDSDLQRLKLIFMPAITNELLEIIIMEVNEKTLESEKN